MIHKQPFFVEFGLSANNAPISNVADPLGAQDAATKHYVDATAGGSVHGPNTTIQFNDGGFANGDANLVWSKASAVLSVNGIANVIQFISTHDGTITQPNFAVATGGGGGGMWQAAANRHLLHFAVNGADIAWAFNDQLNGISQRSDGLIGWNSGSSPDAGATIDTAFWRAGGGIVTLGGNTSGNTSGTLKTTFFLADNIGNQSEPQFGFVQSANSGMYLANGPELHFALGGLGDGQRGVMFLDGNNLKLTTHAQSGVTISFGTDNSGHSTFLCPVDLGLFGGIAGSNADHLIWITNPNKLRIVHTQDAPWNNWGGLEFFSNAAFDVIQSSNAGTINTNPLLINASNTATINTNSLIVTGNVIVGANAAYKWTANVASDTPDHALWRLGSNTTPIIGVGNNTIGDTSGYFVASRFALPGNYPSYFGPGLVADRPAVWYGGSLKAQWLTDRSTVTDPIDFKGSVAINVDANNSAWGCFCDHNTLSPDNALAIKLGNGQSVTKPTANSYNRGTIWHTYNGTGVADTVETCVKKSDDTYEWLAIVTVP